MEDEEPLYISLGKDWSWIEPKKVFEKELAEQRRRTLEEVSKMVEEVENSNDSNGRYNACVEIQSFLVQMLNSMTACRNRPS